MLDGFKPINVISGSAVLSITNNGLSFNKNVIQKMGAPRYILFLLNKETKQMAIQKTSEENDMAVHFAHDNISNKNGIRYNNRDIEQLIESLMNWDLSTKIYRIDGIYHDDEQAMVFDLKTARVFPKRKRVGK